MLPEHKHVLLLWALDLNLIITGGVEEELCPISAIRDDRQEEKKRFYRKLICLAQQRPAGPGGGPAHAFGARISADLQRPRLFSVTCLRLHPVR